MRTFRNTLAGLTAAAAMATIFTATAASAATDSGTPHFTVSAWAKPSTDGKVCLDRLVFHTDLPNVEVPVFVFKDKGMGVNDITSFRGYAYLNVGKTGFGVPIHRQAGIRYVAAFFGYDAYRTEIDSRSCTVGAVKKVDAPNWWLGL